MNTTVIAHLQSVRANVPFSSDEVTQYVVRRSDRSSSAPATEQTPVVAMETDQRGSSSDEAFESADESPHEPERRVAAQQVRSAVTQATKPRSTSPKAAASAQRVDQRPPQDVQFPLQTPVSERMVH